MNKMCHNCAERVNENFMIYCEKCAYYHEKINEMKDKLKERKEMMLQKEILLMGDHSIKKYKCTTY